MRRVVVASFWVFVIALLIPVSRGFAQEPGTDLFAKVSAPQPAREQLSAEQVVREMAEMSRRIARLEKELAKYKKLDAKLKELRADVEFLTEEYLDDDDDDDDDNLFERVWDEIDEEMDEEDDEDSDKKYRKWQRRRQLYRQSSQVPGFPHRTDDELERSADLLAALREDEALWGEYQRKKDIPAYRAAIEAYRAENLERSEKYFDQQRQDGFPMPSGA